jgi:hypothetical protein
MHDYGNRHEIVSALVGASTSTNNMDDFISLGIRLATANRGSCYFKILDHNWDAKAIRVQFKYYSSFNWLHGPL